MCPMPVETWGKDVVFGKKPPKPSTHFLVSGVSWPDSVAESCRILSHGIGGARCGNLETPHTFTSPESRDPKSGLPAIDLRFVLFVAGTLFGVKTSKIE